MNSYDFGANEFTFAGDRTQTTYLTQTPGPILKGTSPGGRLQYQGPEGDHVFSYGCRKTRATWPDVPLTAGCSASRLPERVG